MRIAALALALLAGAAGPSFAAGDFDGTWDVTVTCPPMQDGTLGYTYRFPATVAGGTLHGENGQPHIADWLTLNGAIRPDGAALLAAEGLSGSPDYAAGRVARLSAYHYNVRAQFGATQGTGQRIEIRACAFTFVKS